MQSPPPLRFREFAVGLLVLVLAMLPRLRDVSSPFDREFEGMQGAIFSVAAINYERLGFGAADGYPVLNLDLDRAHPATWYAYANHPPLVPWLAWAGFKLFALPEWNERLGMRGVEYAPRIPFLAFHAAFLLALWFAGREAYGPLAGFLTLLMGAIAPALVIYAPLVNYENPALFAIALGAGYYARFCHSNAARGRLGLAFAFALGSCVTFAPLFFLATFVAHAGLSLGRRALAQLALPLLAALAPLALHAFASRIALAALGQAPDGVVARVRVLLAPLFDGSHPVSEWARLQGQRLEEWYSPALIAAALAGLAVAVWGWKRPKSARPVPLAELTLIAGAAYLLAFYRHTLDPQHPFLMLAAPALCLAAALAIAAATRRVRALAPQSPVPAAIAASLLVALVLVPCATRELELRDRFRSDGTELAANRARPELPMPDVVGDELRALVPEATFAIVPAQLGFNQAVSYYAWRTLWPIDSPDDTLPIAVAQRFMPNAPHLLVLPKEPPPSARAACDLLRARFAIGPPVRASAHFEAWPAP